MSSVIYEIIRKNHKEIINVYNEDKTTPSVTFKGKKNKIEQIDNPSIPVKHESEIIKQRQKYFEAVHMLRSKVVPIKKIANTLGISKNTVKKYLSTYCLQGKQIAYKNKYHLYIDDIKKCCEKHISISKIYEEIKKKGFDVCSSAFHEWFKQQFLIYYKASKQHFNNIYNSIDLREFRSKNKKQFMSARICASNLNQNQDAPVYVKDIFLSFK